MELVVVMTVTLVLTGLMLPALVQIRENAHRVICSSNLRQIGLAVVLYADDNNGRLPHSVYGVPGSSYKPMARVISSTAQWRRSCERSRLTTADEEPDRRSPDRG